MPADIAKTTCSLGFRFPPNSLKAFVVIRIRLLAKRAHILVNAWTPRIEGWRATKNNQDAWQYFGLVFFMSSDVAAMVRETIASNKPFRLFGYTINNQTWNCHRPYSSKQRCGNRGISQPLAAPPPITSNYCPGAMPEGKASWSSGSADQSCRQVCPPTPIAKLTWLEGISRNTSGSPRCRLKGKTGVDSEDGRHRKRDMDLQAINVARVWLQSMTPDAIRHAVEHCQPGQREVKGRYKKFSVYDVNLVGVVLSLPSSCCFAIFYGLLALGFFFGSFFFPFPWHK